MYCLETATHLRIISFILYQVFPTNAIRILFFELTPCLIYEAKDIVIALVLLNQPLYYV